MKVLVRRTAGDVQALRSAEDAEGSRKFRRRAGRRRPARPRRRRSRPDSRRRPRPSAHLRLCHRTRGRGDGRRAAAPPRAGRGSCSLRQPAAAPRALQRKTSVRAPISNRARRTRVRRRGDAGPVVGSRPAVAERRDGDLRALHVRRRARSRLISRRAGSGRTRPRGGRACGPRRRRPSRRRLAARPAANARSASA